MTLPLVPTLALAAAVLSAAAKRSTPRMEMSPSPPVKSTHSHSPATPTMQLIQKPV